LSETVQHPNELAPPEKVKYEQYHHEEEENESSVKSIHVIDSIDLVIVYLPNPRVVYDLWEEK
jgi:hypothetical protein